MAWLINGLSAFGAWRTFAVRADLIWMVAFLLLALVAGNRGLEAYRWYQQVTTGAVTLPIADMLGDVAIGTLRFAALEMVGVIASLFAFRARRFSLD